MSLVWLELLQLMKGRSSVALTHFSSSGSILRIDSQSHTPQAKGTRV
jgi:hypothetical protein